MGRPRFRLLPHAADVRLAVWGDTPEELIRNAVAGALRLALGRSPVGRPERWLVLAPWPGDLGRQLVRAVNEAFYLLYVRRELVCTVAVAGRSARLGVATLPPAVRPEAEAKAATFHDLRPERGVSGRLRAVLTIDL